MRAIALASLLLLLAGVALAYVLVPIVRIALLLPNGANW